MLFPSSSVGDSMQGWWGWLMGGHGQLPSQARCCSQVSCPPALASCCGQRMLSAPALCMPISVSSSLQRLGADMLLRCTVWASTAPGVAHQRPGELDMGAAHCYC